MLEDSGEMDKELSLDEDNQSRSSLEPELLLQQINKCYLLIYNNRILNSSTQNDTYVH